EVRRLGRVGRLPEGAVSLDDGNVVGGLVELHDDPFRGLVVGVGGAGALNHLLHAGRRHGHTDGGERPGEFLVGQAGRVQFGEDAGALGAEFVDALLCLLLCGGGRGELAQQVAVLRVDLDHATPSCWRCLAAKADQVSRSTTRVGTVRGSPSHPSPTCSPSNTTTCPWSSAGAPLACSWK